MTLRVASCLMFAAILGLFLASAQAVQAADKIHTGKVVSVTEGTGDKDGKLAMSNKDGTNEHTHMISSSAKITLDNKTVKLGELKKGDEVTVTTDEKGKVISVAATRA